MSVMLYPCIFCVALLMDLFVLLVTCLTVFVNSLVFLTFPIVEISSISNSMVTKELSECKAKGTCKTIMIMLKEIEMSTMGINNINSNHMYFQIGKYVAGTRLYSNATVRIVEI